MEDEIFVQSLILKLVKENGKEETVKFIGISPYTDEEFAKLVLDGKTLKDILAEGQSMMVGKPIPLQKAVAGDNYSDIVDMIRAELTTNKPTIDE